MKRYSGMSLVESVVAIGLSGLFLVLISTMLAQVLQLLRANQDELIAVSAAELLLENAKTTPYSDLKNLSSTGSTYELQVNKQSPASPLRISPVQLDLESANLAFGTVDGTDGTIASAKKWSPTSGNYFDATATEELIDSTSETSNLSSVKVTVTVRYKSPTAASSTPYTKILTRKAYVFEDGARFQ